MRENTSPPVKRGKWPEGSMGASNRRMCARLAPIPALRGKSLDQALAHVPWKPSGQA